MTNPGQRPLRGVIEGQEQTSAEPRPSARFSSRRITIISGRDSRVSVSRKKTPLPGSILPVPIIIHGSASSATPTNRATPFVGKLYYNRTGTGSIYNRNLPSCCSAVAVLREARSAASAKTKDCSVETNACGCLLIETLRFLINKMAPLGLCSPFPSQYYYSDHSRS